MMDTPYGRFAVTIPQGVHECEPLLVPVPVAQAGGELSEAEEVGTPRGDKARERERQLRTLMELGFHAQVATP